MVHKIDYESAYKIALDQNISEVREAILEDDPSMRVKLENYAEKFGIPIRFLKHKILSDNLFANSFIKDPSKQSLHQKVAADFIESINCVEDFCQLPAGGQNARYICDDGTVRMGENSGQAKSIDFYWVYDGNIYYAAHKHTSEEGGAQDNQFKDLQLFLENASKSKLASTFFLAIGDGDYYQKRYRNGSEEYATRIDYMNKKYGTDHAVAITTDDLEKFLLEHSSYREASN